MMTKKTIVYIAVDESEDKQYFLASTLNEVKAAIAENKDLPKLTVYKVKSTHKYRAQNV